MVKYLPKTSFVGVIIVSNRTKLLKTLSSSMLIINGSSTVVNQNYIVKFRATFPKLVRFR